jgi:hypothetical protein
LKNKDSFFLINSDNEVVVSLLFSFVQQGSINKNKWLREHDELIRG